MASQLVGLLGLKRSGKDTFASRLVEEHGFTRFGFADAIKDAAYALDPFVEVTFHERTLISGGAGFYPLSVVVDEIGWEAAKEIEDVRRLLQRFGTEAGRDVYGPDHWTDIVKRKVEALDGPAVITDVRFPNEILLVEALGGTSVRVVRPGRESTDTHPSEVALAETPVDHVVLNDATIRDLHAKADAFVAKV